MTTQQEEATRDRYGEVLTRLAMQDRNVVAMDCDLGRSTRSYRITEVDPNRFIEMGIAEQDMISTAAGLAQMGKIVFVNSFAVFITGRCYDQIRQQVALPMSNVKICGSSSGLTQGPDGATHQSVEDIALMRSLPNMMVLVPADGNQTEDAIKAAYTWKGPVYLRLSRYVTVNFIPSNLRFELGKAQVLREGEVAVLVSCGPILHNVLRAADLLLEQGIHVGVVNCHTIKPLDIMAVEQLASRFRLIVSVEEHNIIGGLGSALSEVLAESSSRRAVLSRIGIRDCFGESGTAAELLKKHGLNAEGIAAAIAHDISRIIDAG